MEVLTQSIEALSGQGFSAQAKLQEWIEADPQGCSRNALRYLQAAAPKLQEALLRLLSTCDSFSHILASPAVPLPVATELFKRVV
ncbi:MAG: hypothetical protein WKF37_12005, partial [Bryobacteraceae bacterium]